MTSIVEERTFKVIDMMRLPSEFEDETCNECPGNDTFRRIYPGRFPKLTSFLIKNGFNPDDDYIGKWSW